MWLTAVRDVAIVLLALESIVIGVLLALMLLQLRKLARLLSEEIRPILNTTHETVDTVSRTTAFVSTNVVAPLIKAQSYTAGAKAALRNLFFIGRSVRPRRSQTPGSKRPEA
jgi:hypothetical protein